MLRKFSWIIEGKIAGSGRPGLDSPVKEDLQFIRTEGIKAILTFTDEPLPKKALGWRWAYLHVPIEVMSPPTQLQVRQALDFIKKQHRRKKPVLVHCTRGEGRTGTILACYLVSEGYTAQAAIDKLRELRPGSIETREQEQVVFRFALSGEY